MIKTKLSIDAYGLECDLCKATNTRSAMILETGNAYGMNICETCADQIKATFAPTTYEAPAVVLDTTIADLQKQVDALKEMMAVIADFQEATDRELGTHKASVTYRLAKLTSYVTGLKD